MAKLTTEETTEECTFLTSVDQFLTEFKQIQWRIHIWQRVWIPPPLFKKVDL